MDYKELIKEAFENSCEKRFHECPKCGGYGKICTESIEGETESDCICDGTGINPNENIPEKLMLIIGELGEAQEALRKNRYADWEGYDFILESSIQCELPLLFNNRIKDTFEDEIADVYIRLFDLCGYLKIKPNFNETFTFEDTGNISSMLWEIGGQVYKYVKNGGVSNDYWAGKTIIALNMFCYINNIDIEKHIKAKMTYNKTRPRKHGKEF